MEIEKVSLVGKGEELSFQIPEVLIKEFAKELRVVIRHPWIVGIPVPERLRPEVLKGLKDFDIMITPRQFQR